MTPDELDEARKIASGLFAVTDLIVEYYEHEAIRMYPKLIRCIDDQAAEIKRLQAMNPFRADVPIGIRIAENHFAYSDGEGSAMIASGLNLLREKDPELCGRMRRMPVYVHQDEQLTIDLTKSDNTELVAAWLQHCLQNAVRARGWSYRLIWASSVDICKAFICTGPGIHESVNCDTEAEALLRAYLAAIQEAT